MTQSLSNTEIAKSIRQLGEMLEISGEPVFRVIAYRRAAESIAALPDSVAALKERGELQTIQGVGKGIAESITELLETGQMSALTEVEKQFPIGVTELLSVPDIGPKRARQLHDSLGVTNLGELRDAVDAGRLSEVPGLGAKGVKRLTESLQTMTEPDLRIPLPAAHRLGLELIALLRERSRGLDQIELAGSLRRFRETVGDLDLVAASTEPQQLVSAFSTLPAVARVEMSGENRCRVVLQSGQAADLRVVPPEQWGSLLYHFTGSKYHNVKLRDLAITRGWSMSEYGFRWGDELVTCATEADVFAFFEMEFILPPMREETGEIELSLRRELPVVIGLDELKGDMHCHTTWSDGTGSVLEMARAALERGYAYLCITDHSYGLGVANGLDADRLRAQRAEVVLANEELSPFRVLHGIEVEVRGDGSLDFPDEVLAELDVVIASVHSGTRRGREIVTGRSLAALRHPLVDILAHPTGRILGSRAPGDFDVEAIIAAALETGTALEINGSRVDLNDVNARAAAKAGCTIAIDSDAHSADGLGEVLYATGTAQRGWVPRDQVLNAQPLDAMLSRLKRNRTQRI